MFVMRKASQCPPWMTEKLLDLKESAQADRRKSPKDNLKEEKTKVLASLR